MILASTVFVQSTRVTDVRPDVQTSRIAITCALQHIMLLRAKTNLQVYETVKTAVGLCKKLLRSAQAAVTRCADSLKHSLRSLGKLQGNWPTWAAYTLANTGRLWYTVLQIKTADGATSTPDYERPLQYYGSRDSGRNDLTRSAFLSCYCIICGNRQSELYGFIVLVPYMFYL